MQLIEGSTTLSKFYTPAWVSEALISNVNYPNPRSILDLGCGEGALATAARTRWKSAKIITVDIDDLANPKAQGLQHGDPALHRHVIADALDPLLGKRAKIDAGSVDLAICNPPFQRPKWRASFGTILEAACLSHVLQTSSDVTSDLLFIAQNMRYLRKRGLMGLIVPDAIITGERMRGLRTALANQIQKVVQLPRTVFSNTEAQTFILTIARGASNDTIELQELTSDGVYSDPLMISADQSYSRLDYRFHVARSLKTSSRRSTLRELGVEIVRGTLSSVEVRKSRLNTFHTSGFRHRETGEGISLPRRKIPKGAATCQIIAKTGDILLARIDRNLEKKIVMVECGEAALSDCVYRLRCPANIRQRILAGLSSRRGRMQIEALARGNGARHISIASLLTVSV